MAVGQFFSQRFGYGVHALAFIATKPAGELTTLPELAAWMKTIWPNASDTYLSNVVQRLARVEDVAAVTLFLASEDAAYMTGQAINVTGGREMH